MIKLSNEVKKALSKEQYYNEEGFITDCKAYIAAVKSGRIKYDVTSVSSSGMSRRITIQSYEGTMSKGWYRNYFMMMKVLGFKRNDDDTFTISGCGMNMLFATNYNIIGSLHFMGFINKATCKTLQQKVN